MNDEQLQQLVSQLSLDYFEKPFIGQSTFNFRLRTTGGRYLPSKRLIEVNPKYLSELGINEVIGIIKHELCHYYLHIEGKPFGHGDRAFKELLRKTKSPRHCQPLPSARNARSTPYHYQCQNCDQVYKRQRKVNSNKYSCGRCGGKIETVN